MKYQFNAILSNGKKKIAFDFVVGKVLNAGFLTHAINHTQTQANALIVTNAAKLLAKQYQSTLTTATLQTNQKLINYKLLQSTCQNLTSIYY